MILIFGILGILLMYSRMLSVELVPIVFMLQHCTDNIGYPFSKGQLKVLCTGHDLVGAEFMPDYPDANLWSTTHHVQISIVDLDANTEADDSCPVRYRMMEQTHITDENLQKELLSEYERNSKNKSQEYFKFLAD